MDYLSRTDPEISRIIEQDQARQRRTINLIASENYVSRAVLEAQGSYLTYKYAEGYPGRRYYGGCENELPSKKKYTWELSDHLPLYVQVNTDLEDQQLEQILNK